jgi:hypothetical protein
MGSSGPRMQTCPVVRIVVRVAFVFPGHRFGALGQRNEIGVQQTCTVANRRERGQKLRSNAALSLECCRCCAMYRA